MNPLSRTPMIRTATRADLPVESAITSNRVVRNTYRLLSLTLLFSALSARASMALKRPHPGLIITLAGYFGPLFLTTKFRNSALGIAFVFALTGFMGYTLGPILNAYLGLPDGGRLVMTATCATAAIFLGLSGYALTTRKDFSFMGDFLMAGILVAFLAGTFNLFTSLLHLLDFTSSND